MHGSYETTPTKLNLQEHIKSYIGVNDGITAVFEPEDSRCWDLSIDIDMFHVALENGTPREN